MEFLCCFTCLILVVLVPVLSGAAVEREWRHRWVRGSSRAATLDVAGQGAFRAAPIQIRVPVPQRDRAPAWLRFTAFTCRLAGQMAVPWCLIGCMGVLIAVDPVDEFLGAGQLLAIPPTAWAFVNAWASVLLWRAGASLVQGERDHADRSTARAARVATACNAPVAMAILSCPFTDHCMAEAAVAALCCLVPVAHALTVRVTFLGYREEFASCTSRS